MKGKTFIIFLFSKKEYNKAIIYILPSNARNVKSFFLFSGKNLEFSSSSIRCKKKDALHQYGNTSFSPIL